MQILSFPFTNQQSFEGRYPKGIFRDVRDIPNLTCAKCGEYMLQRHEDQKFLSSIRPALKTCLKKSEKIKVMKEYKILQGLAFKYPRDNIDKILLRKEDKTATNKLSPYVVNEIRKITYNAPFIIKKLQKYKEYMDNVNLELFDIMTVYAKKYRNKTFAEIFALPEVYNFHKKVVRMEKETLSVKAQRIFNQMELILKRNNSKTDLEELKYINAEVEKIVRNKVREDDRDLLLEQLYSNIISKLRKTEDAEKFKKLMELLPKAKLSPSRIIVKSVDNDSSFGIIYHLFNKLSTFDHVTPKSQKGENRRANGIYLCLACNNDRGTTPYKTEYEKFKDFAKNTQKQLSTVMRYILRGKLIGYDFYPQEVKKTLYEASGRIFKLDIKKYLKAQIKKYSDSVKKQKEQMEKSKMSIWENRKEIMILQKKHEQLKQKNKQNCKNYIEQKYVLSRFKQSEIEEKDFKNL